MLRRVLTLALLPLAAGLGLERAARGDDSAPNVTALLAASKDRRASVQERWLALRPAVRAREAIAALRSEDPSLARAGAVLVDPLWLDLAGLVRLSHVLAKDPLARFAPGEALEGLANGRHAFGSADLPAIWSALITAPEGIYVPHEELHASLRGAQVPELVPLLARLPDGRFLALLWDLMNQAEGESDDERHATYLRAFRYGLLRLEAIATGTARPGFEAVRPLTPTSGIPPEAMELARATWGRLEIGLGMVPGPDGHDDERVPSGPRAWLARWLRHLHPVPTDVGRLVEIVRMPDVPPEVAHWAGTWVARLDDGARTGVREDLVVGDGAEVAALAAVAEAAARGSPAAWRHVEADAPPLLRWRADPPAALELAWRALREGSLPYELVPARRAARAYDFGIGIPETAISELTTRLRAGGASPWGELAFFAQVVPDRMTVADAERIVQRLQAHDPGGRIGKHGVDQDLAALEVRTPDALIRLLQHWHARAVVRDDRFKALRLLARLGHAETEEQVDRMVEFRRGIDSTWLGRVRHPHMQIALTRELDRAAAAGDARAELDALQGLSVWHGLPAGLTMVFRSASPREGETPVSVEARRRRVRELVREGDPLGALLLHTEGVGSEEMHYLAEIGRVKDGRVRERLLAWRNAPELGLRWPATCALALSGDVDARREWTGFLAQARTFLIEPVAGPVSLTLDADPELVEAWIDRLSDSCCYARQGASELGAVLTNLPVARITHDGGFARSAARSWWASNRSHLARSQLANGWVPTAR